MVIAKTASRNVAFKFKFKASRMGESLLAAQSVVLSRPRGFGGFGL